MAVSRNPDEAPKADPAQDDEAFTVGIRRVQVICDTPDEEPDDPDSPPISFFGYTYFVPRRGELMILEDGKRVQVQEIYYKIGTVGKSNMKALIPTIYATLCRAGK